jgi:hypothetical protein
LDNLRQTGSVAEYYAKFEELVHCILLYNDAYNDVYLVTRFMGGLKEEIRAPIALHRPNSVDTASALALLQEEELNSSRRTQPFKYDAHEFGKSSSWVCSASDKAKSSFTKNEPKKLEKPAVDEKWNALLAHRKANGLCYTCGEKWTGRGHKCPKQVSIHVLQELMEMFQLEVESDSESTDEEQCSDDTVCAVQGADTQQTPKKRKTMRFRGFLGK